MINSAFSVVIPFYNRSHYFERILKSLISQKTDLIKSIYIVDNGSTYDEIYKIFRILEVYEGLYKFNVIVVSSITRGNANPSRNLGYFLSDTDYVAFLDSDDWWENDYLNTVSSFINNNVDFEGLYSGARVHLGKNNILKIKSRQLNEIESPLDFLVGKNKVIAQTSSYIINKKLVGLSVLWDEELTRHQDYDYFINFSTKHRWLHLDITLVNVDWEGNELKSIDFNGVIKFFEKWRLSFSHETSIYYLLMILRCVVAKNASDQYFDYFISNLAKQGKSGYILSFLMKRAFIIFLLKVKSTIKSFIHR